MFFIKHKIFLKVIAVVIMTAAIAACGTDSHHFHLEGRFLKMNMADFYVYSPDGLINGIDTIHVKGGRFAYEIPCEREGVIVVVLPNFTELPVFVKPGESVDMKADASHIKDIEITGTKENENMTEWSKSIDGMSPPDQCAQAEVFIRKNPKSIVSRWLLSRYFVQRPDANLRKAKQLTSVIDEVNGTDPHSARFSEGVQRVSQARVGDKLPLFGVKDIYGRNVSSRDLMSGKVVIVAWASWNYDGMNLQRAVRDFIKKAEGEGRIKPKVVSISLDPSVVMTKDKMKNDSLPWPVVCDGMMWDSPLVKTLGISFIPDNIIVSDGKIIGRHMKQDDVIKELEK